MFSRWSLDLLTIAAFEMVPLHSIALMAEQDGHRGALQQAIITSIRARVRGDENRIKSPCLGVAWAKDRQSLLGYAFGNTRNFLQIYLAMPSLLPKVKNRVVSLRVSLAAPLAARPLFAPNSSSRFERELVR